MRFLPATPSGASLAVLDLGERGAGGPVRVYLGGPSPPPVGMCSST
jgi:hypothetical protein